MTLHLRAVSWSPISVEVTFLKTLRGTWVAQSLERPTPDFGSGHDHLVCEFKPHVGLYADSAEPAWDSLPAPPLLTFSLSLSK